MYIKESFVYKALFRNSPPTQATNGQVVRGVIGFSFQLAIIQYQLKTSLVWILPPAKG